MDRAATTQLMCIHTILQHEKVVTCDGDGDRSDRSNEANCLCTLRMDVATFDKLHALGDMLRAGLFINANPDYHTTMHSDPYDV